MTTNGLNQSVYLEFGSWFNTIEFWWWHSFRTHQLPTITELLLSKSLTPMSIQQVIISQDSVVTCGQGSYKALLTWPHSHSWRLPDHWGYIAWVISLFMCLKGESGKFARWCGKLTVHKLVLDLCFFNYAATLLTKRKGMAVSSANRVSNGTGQLPTAGEPCKVPGWSEHLVTQLQSLVAPLALYWSICPCTGIHRYYEYILWIYIS